MIRLQNVYKRYPSGREALSNLSLHVTPGEMVFLTGPSGAGKSTLLKLIALIERPTRGQLIIRGKNVTRISRKKVPQHRRHVGIVFQDHKLLFDRSIYDNIALPLVIAGLPEREIAKRVRAALDQVGLLGREKRSPIELSSGEQQRIGIARAVVSKPPLLIADEPTGNLDPQLSLEIMQLFKRFNAVGVTVIIASHDLGLIKQLGNRVIRLKDGQLADAEEPDGRDAA
ncbi:MAG: cell division ATP-binding protein FtsE [Gammaproteobacteria bacterium]|nr:cell division ATP-binding protein FtsE [Gammaproteobacteria bacterium]